jgi:hypothetical protein
MFIAAMLQFVILLVISPDSLPRENITIQVLLTTLILFRILDRDGDNAVPGLSIKIILMND